MRMKNSSSIKWATSVLSLLFVVISAYANPPKKELVKIATAVCQRPEYRSLYVPCDTFSISTDSIGFEKWGEPTYCVSMMKKVPHQNPQTECKVWISQKKLCPVYVKFGTWEFLHPLDDMVVCTFAQKPDKLHAQNNSLAVLTVDGEQKILNRTKQLQSDKSMNLKKVYRAGKWGFINADNEEVIPVEYSYIHFWEKNLALAVRDGKCGLLDRAGKVLLPCIYDKIALWQPYNNVSVSKSGKWGYFTNQGQQILPVQYDSIGRFTSYYDSLAVIKLDGKYGFIRPDGTLATPIQYDKAEVFSPFSIGVFSVAGRYGCVNSKGQPLLAAEYDAIRFHHEYLILAKNGKFGLYDIRTRLLVPCVYSRVRVGIEPYFELNGKQFKLCHTGEWEEVPSDRYITNWD